MVSNNFRSLLAFLRVSKSVRSTCQLYLLKYYHKRPGKTIEKYLSNWKSSKSKSNYKTISLTAAASFGAYACSVISKKSDSLLEEENCDEFDELFFHETVKEDVELLRKFGPVPYLLIGSGPATIAAFRAIRLNDPTAKILMVSEEQCDPYRRSTLSSELWYFKNFDPSAKRKYVFFDAYYLSVQQMLENSSGGLALIRGKKVLKIDPVSQVVTLDTGEQIAYKKCLLDTGTKPKSLPVFQEAEKDIKEHLTLFHSIQDFLKLERLSRRVKYIAVVGGGFLGSELTSGLNEYNKSTGLNVIQIFPDFGQLNNILPEYLSKWITKKFQSKGIHIVPGATVKAVNKSNNKIELHLSNNEIVSVDHVVVAVGSEPNTELALSSGLETHDKHGGFSVNAEMKARKNLWIAGDGTCFYDIKLGRCRIEHYEDAVRSGRIAGENMTGSGKPLYYQTSWWSVLAPDMFCEGVGDIDAKLQTVGVFPKPSSNNTLELTVDEISTNITSKIGEQTDINVSTEGQHPQPLDPSDTYRKGVVFYLRDGIIVGILLWNIFAGTRIAKKIIKESKSHEEIIEIAKLFQLAPTVNEVSGEIESEQK